MTDAIIVALIGIGGTLLGVTVTSLFSSWNIRRQLTHDRLMRDKQRELETKRDVYLKVIEEFGNKSQIFNSLLNEFTKPDGTFTQPPTTARGKLELMANLDTIRAVTALDVAIMQIQLLLLEKVLPIKALRLESVSLQNNIENHRLKHQQLLDELQSIIQKSPQPSELTRATNLQSYSKEIEADWDSAIEKQHDTNKRVVLLSFEAFAFIQEIIPKLSEPYRNAILALRKELGFSIDESSYREITEQANMAVKELLASMTQTFNKAYQEYSKP